MARYTKKTSAKVAQVMHERKLGTLRTSTGTKVTSRKQAIAIGLAQARRAGEPVPRGPRKKLRVAREVDEMLKSRSKRRRPSEPARSVAYRLQLTPAELEAVTFARGHYAWADMLAAHASENGLVAFSEPEMWQWTDDVDSDAEGGHSPFPLASAAFQAKLQRFYDERI